MVTQLMQKLSSFPKLGIKDFLIIMLSLGIVVSLASKDSYMDIPAKQWYLKFAESSVAYQKEKEYSSLLFNKLTRTEKCIQEFDKLSDSIRSLQVVEAYCAVFDLSEEALQNQ